MSETELKEKRDAAIARFDRAIVCSQKDVEEATAALASAKQRLDSAIQNKAVYGSLDLETLERLFPLLNIHFNL